MSDIRERLARTSCRIDCQNAASGGFCADSCRLHPESVLMVRELSRIDAILSDLDAQGLVIVPREPTIAQWDIWWGPIFMSLPDRARERLSCDDWHKTGEVMKAEWLKAAEQ